VRLGRLRVRGVSTPPLATLRPLLGRLQDLKRVRTPDTAGRSLAAGGFARAWAALAAGEPVRTVAVRETAASVAATELAGIDAAVLRAGALADADVRGVFRRAVTAAGRDIDPAFLEELLAADPPGPARPPPAFVARLADQPRAGATHPTKPRLMLDPPESHADHCYIVAVSAALLAPLYGADPTAPFLAGLAHHLHNVWLPDGGFAGEELLGEHLKPVMARFTARALEQVPAGLARQVEAAFDLLPSPDTPAAKAFHAADVLDRVLWMTGYERAATFRLGVAMDDLELVHPGPTQAFLNEVLLAAGVWPR
jgi:5'-deoxynucleotidase YfbR-like HD superfamily hydrolase